MSSNGGAATTFSGASDGPAQRQNSEGALRLLLAQSRLHTRAKRWLAVRTSGMLVLGLGGPLVSLLWPESAAIVGAITAGWVFLTRVVTDPLQRRLVTKATSIQDSFDRRVFRLPAPSDRSLPSDEDIATLTRDLAAVMNAKQGARLRNWYPFQQGVPERVNIAIAQRANATYSDRLLRVVDRTWWALLITWLVGLMIVGLVLDVTLGSFMLGLALPVLPAVLDVTEYGKELRIARSQREALRHEIEGAIREDSISIEKLEGWQARTLISRRTSPQVPDIIYRLFREKNEDAMNYAARSLIGEQAP